MRWLGTAGFELRTNEGRILIDPFVSRQPMGELIFGRLAPDLSLIESLFKDTRAELILVGHSHYDHLLDAPTIARMTGAKLIGSRSTCLISARLANLSKEDCLPTKGGRFSAGPFQVHVARAAHSTTFFGVLIDGAVDRPPRWRNPHLVNMPVGEVLLFVIRVKGLVIVHLSSANVPEDPLLLRALVPEGVDLLLPALALRENSPGYVQSLIAQLKPKLIMPHHPVLPTFPLSDQLPEDAEKAFSDFRKEAQGAKVQRPAPFKEYVFTAEARVQK